jgi:4-hydroxymandelate synthase
MPPRVQLDAVELWVGDLEQTRRSFAQFGFTPNEAGLACHPDENIAGFISGQVRLVLRQGTTTANPITRHVARHGDGVGVLALRCDDVLEIAHRAASYGLATRVEHTGATIDLLGDGTIVHIVRNRPIVSLTSAPPTNAGPVPGNIDHVTYCLPFGTIESVARCYREVFGLSPVVNDEFSEVGEQTTGMRSMVLRSVDGFTVVLTSPASATSAGQTQRFLTTHRGAGVQHVAFVCTDLAGTVQALRSKGVRFLDVPEDHLERSYRRLESRALPWDVLRREQILVDADNEGLLFQLFTHPIIEGSGFFFEFIQRAGATGFGAANVRALFAAVDAAIRQAPAEEPGMSTSPDASRGDRHWTRQLVRTAGTEIPFYRKHLAGREAASFAELPSFDKSMTAGHGRFPLSAGGAPGAHRVLATSGTTGDRLYIAFDTAEWNRTATWLAQVAHRVGVTSADVLLNTHCYGLWVGGPALDLLATGSGAGLVPLGPTGPGIILGLLGDGIGTAISATPSYMRRLIEAAEQARFDLRNTPLRFGFIGAEPAEQSLRNQLRSRLPDDFRWIELYGLTETGGPSVAFAPDPSVPELEVNTEDFWIEVLDLHHDRPAAPGEVGELTITTRRTDGRTPLIRYRTRDLVRAAAGPIDAPTRLSRILGRADHSLKIGGVLVYPSAIAEIVSELLPPTAEWRAVVRRSGQDDELVVEAEASPDGCHAVEHAFRNRVGAAVTVNALRAGALSRSREKTQRILIDSDHAAGARVPEAT